MLDPKTIRNFQEVVGKEPRLVRLPPDKCAVFVGDTHGDREATEEVLQRYFDVAHVLVFLGDYVDRGPDSFGNLRLLMEAKINYPERIVLLMGNHEAWGVTPFTPADFWHRLSPNEEQHLAQALTFLPFAAYHPAGVLALHGVLPDVDNIEEITHVSLGSANWRKVTWGDWVDGPGYCVDPGFFGRPAYGADYFFEVMNRLGLHVLVRAHQPDAPLFLFANRCLTLFTTNAYGPGLRRVALLHPGQIVHSARDLEIREL